MHFPPNYDVDSEIEESLDHEKTLAKSEDKTLQTVMKIRQRFPFDPRDWPEEEKPFAMIDRNFMGKIMHVVSVLTH